MKTFLIVILFFLCTPLFSQTVNQYEQANSDRCLSNTINNSNVVLNKSFIDNNYLLQYMDWFYWLGSDWVFGARDCYIYDDSFILTEILQQGLDDSMWTNVRRWIFEYDSNKNKSQELQLIWRDSSWVYEDRTFYEYDSNNNCIKHHHQFYEWYGSGEFIDSRMCFYTFDSNNNCIGHTAKRFEDNYWVNSFRHVDYVYDSNDNRISYIYQSWRDSLWVDCNMELNTYDNNDNITEKLILVLSSTGSEWMNDSKVIYSYDLENNLKESLVQIWNGGLWMNVGLDKYKYNPISGIVQDKNRMIEYTLSNNYPNPFNPRTKISYSIPSQSHVSLKVFDVLGREIATLVNKEQSVGNYEVEFDASNLTSGVYFYRIQTGDFVETKKMVLMK